MADPLTCLAVIMARGGSQGVPGKNLRIVAGKPLIAWTIEAALQCPLLDRVVVTTDSFEIADIGRTFGAEVPFMRPAELAHDDTPGMVPLLHAVKWLGDNENYSPDLVMLLQPTSPLRTAGDITAAIELLLEKSADTVVSLSPVDQHPYIMKVVEPDGRIRDYVKLDQPPDRRQDFPPLYALNGALYLARLDVLLERESFYPDMTYGLIMPGERSLDVDTPWDLYLADLILRDRGEHAAHQSG
jgi:CMP-N,N'-diacetyllegionaminic acid synthase